MRHYVGFSQIGSHMCLNGKYLVIFQNQVSSILIHVYTLHCCVIHRLSDVVQKVSKKKIPSYVNNLVLEICCDNADGEDVEVPYIKYKFR